MHNLICYDISDDRRRRRVVRVLEGHGERLHESAFECRLRPAQLTKLLRKLRRLLDEEDDKLIVYRVCERDRPDVLHAGQSKAMDLTSAVVV